MTTTARIPVALSLDGFAVDARTAFDIAANAGYSGIAVPTNHAELKPSELSATARRQVRQILGSRQLTLDALRVAAPRAGLSDPKTIERTVDNTRAAITLAHEMGVSTVALYAGPLQGEVNTDAMLEAARVLAGEADKVGITLAFSSDAADKLGELLRAVGYERAKANVETARAVAAGQDAAKVLEMLAGRVGEVTCADAIRAGAKVRMVELGEGQMDWQAFFALLQEMDFRGPRVVDVRETANPIAAATNAAAILRPLLRS